MWSATLRSLTSSLGTAPWFTLLNAAFPECLAAWGQSTWRERFNQQATAQALASGSGKALRFESASLLPSGIAYEEFIFNTGKVPSRDNPHDFFNALIWLAFGKTKALLNRWQAQQIAAYGIGASRGKLRDFLTVFDENALLLIADSSAKHCLEQHDWTTLLVKRRNDWLRDNACLIPIPFGHALLEKLLRPYKALTAHVWSITDLNFYLAIEKNLYNPSFYTLSTAKIPEKAYKGYSSAFLKNFKGLSQLDQHLATALEAVLPDLTTASYLNPLPVLGIPGWWQANEQASFYEDTQVFRPRKKVSLTNIIGPD